MRLLLTCFLSVFLAYSPAFGFMMMVGQHVESSSTSYLIDEDFSDTTTPTGWTDTGTVDHSTAGSVSIDAASKSDSPSFTAQSTVYVALIVNFGAVDNTSSTRVVQLFDGTGTRQAEIQLTTAELPKYYHGTSYAYGSALSVATDYYLWISYTSAGTYTLRVGTTGTYSSASLEVNETNGTSTASVASIQIGQLLADTTGNITFKRVIVSASAIGDI